MNEFKKTKEQLERLQKRRKKQIKQENEVLADELVRKHQLACKKSNCHCIYSNKTYSESCIKCFALYLLENKVKK